ncbi:3-beta hydroxysteroid dehydrogenase/isomerase family-domain-containing protein [Phlebopus sp. FC_14]|nr:3-beta hydroxysteroid dehydrogenase/isomerase family-domain-containing protein [Phlebopus sp. FC_14]
MLGLICGFIIAASLLFLYILLNDRKLSQLPPEANALSPTRFSREDIIFASESLRKSPITIGDVLPPRTGRRYIVVGGAGFLGGWIVLQLLQRGEDPKKIRVLDIRLPTRPDLRTGDAQYVAFFKVDISDASAVADAFRAPWPEAGDVHEDPEITVFHTAANIRFYERLLSLLPRSTKVNHQGTINVINSAKEVGASTLVYTSSGSIAVRRSRFWLWPWETQPKYFVQVLNDDDAFIPKHHDEFFSNYAASKVLGERAVCMADMSPSGSSRILRTGCIRPGNGVFGPGGDVLCGAYLVRKHNPTWVGHILQSFVYVENCALAHLCYEQRLIELERGGSNPDIGGQAFTITDAGRPATFDDIYTALTTLDNETEFPVFSSTVMLSIAHVIEAFYVTKFLLSTSNSFLGRAFASMIPAITGDIVNLQPSLFALTSVHLIFDDSRARLPPARGGLGYSGPYTTLQGLCRTADEHMKADKNGEERSQSGGVSFGFGFMRASKRVDKVQKTVSQQLQVEAVNGLN